MANARNIIVGMQILLPYYTRPDGYHTAAEHDVIYMYETDKPVSDEDKSKLDALGWRQSDHDGWEVFT